MDITMASSRVEGFGTLLRRFRERAALTQEELAEHAGMSARGISDLERGVRSRPYPATVRALARALRLGEVETEQLLARRVGHVPAPIGDLSRRPHCWVPDAPTSLVGREREVGEIVSLLGPRHRLVTVTGTGGTGKTRVAIEAASLLLDQGHEVAFVSLAPLSHHSLVLSAISQMLGIEEGRGTVPEEALRTVLGERDTILVLDNFEHVLGAAPAVAALLDDCPCLRILVTSCHALHLRREYEYPLLPLDLPAPGTVQPIDLLHSAAVRLFEERARAALGNFSVGYDNAASVGAICRLVDGLPLALELAASQLRYFSPSLVVERLADPLGVLVGGPADAPDRQRTLRDAVAWSYSLLAPPEAALFAALGAFAGGFTLDAAQHVGRDRHPDVASGLAALIDASLVQRAPGQDGRLMLLETVRAYARGRLADLDANVTLRRHAEYFLRRTCKAERELNGSDQVEWGKKVEADLDNVRAALTWTLENEPESCLQILLNLRAFFEATDRRAEFGAWSERGLACREAVAPRLRAEVLLANCDFSADYPGTAERLAEAQDIYRAAGDSVGTARVLSVVAMKTAYAGRHEEGHAVAAEAFALWQAIDANADRHMLGVYANLAKWRGDFAEAAAGYEILLEGARAVGNLWLALDIAYQLSEVAAMAWDGEASIRWGQQQLALGEASGRPAATRLAYRAIAWGLCIQGKPEEAGDYARESLRRAWDAGAVDHLNLDTLALVAGEIGQYERAACLWGIVDAARERSAVPLPEMAEQVYAPYRESVRIALGETEWALAYWRGHALLQRDGVFYALE